MGLPVTVYRYTDAGAPQLVNGTAAEWIDILKKVLVDGYGSKQPLGWTLEFENAGAFKVAFRNKVADGGSGGYVQFTSTAGSTAFLNIQTAASMSAIDSFTKVGFGRRIGGNGLVKGWEIIGTSIGFYLITHYTGSLSNGISSANYDWFQQYFIGDIESFIPNDAGVFTLASCNSNQSDLYTSGSYGISGNITIYARIYATDGSSNWQMYSANKVYDMTNAIPDGNAESIGLNHNMILPIFTSSATSMNNSTVTPYARGKLPGLYLSNFAGYRSDNWPKEFVLEGVTWVLLRSYFATRMWIKTGTWYD